MKKVLVSLMLLFSMVGVIDAGYLTISHYRNAIPPCSVVHGCEVVLTSQYATVAGIPVALFGVAFYLAVLFLSLLALTAPHPRWEKLLIFASPFGFLASLYFLFLQLFVLHAICLYCMGSVVTSTLLFVCGIVLWKLQQRPLVPPTA